MSEFTIRVAKRSAARLRLAIDGVSGSGKTHSALLIAAGLLGGKVLDDEGRCRICMIDTEEGSGELEAGKPGIPPFDYLGLSKPYSPTRYAAALEAAAKEHEVVILDSVSHAWTGTGGVLDMHGAATKANLTRAGKEASFQAWRDVSPAHNRLVEALLAVPAHLIATIRTKTAYELVNGKPQKLGMAMVQRDGLEYEFTIVLDLAQEGHVATASKDRTSLFDGEPHVPGYETGERLRRWLQGGEQAQGERVAEMLTQVKAAATIADLQTWWGANEATVRGLTPANERRVKDAIKDRHAALAARGREPTPLPVHAAPAAAVEPQAAREEAPAPEAAPTQEEAAAAEAKPKRKAKPAPEPEPEPEPQVAAEDEPPTPDAPGDALDEMWGEGGES